MTPVLFGAVAIATALGEPEDVATAAGRYVDDPERVLHWGYHTYHRAPAEGSSTLLAAQAASRALTKADLAPAQVDLLVVADSGVPEFLHWDLSTAVARELGLRETRTLLLTQGCAAAVTAYEPIAGAFAIRDDLETVLLVAVNRVSEAHVNRMRANTSLWSDGAVAVVLRRGFPRLRWLATEQISRPDYVDFFRTEYGGSAVPFPPEGSSNLDVDLLARVYQHLRREPDQLTEFVRDLNGQVASVVDRAFVRAGVERTRLARLIYLNDNQHSMADVAKAVGISLNRTNAELAAGLGHFGAADQLICLDRHIARGELAQGDIVALAGISNGMHWFCTLLEV